MLSSSDFLVNIYSYMLQILKTHLLQEGIQDPCKKTIQDAEAIVGAGSMRDSEEKIIALL